MITHKKQYQRRGAARKQGDATLTIHRTSTAQSPVRVQLPLQKQSLNDDYSMQIKSEK
jgi:hypothetical protein